jgi:hypothetical protein
VCPEGAHSVNMHTRCIWTLWLHAFSTVNMHTECVYRGCPAAAEPPDPAQASRKVTETLYKFCQMSPLSTNSSLWVDLCNLLRIFTTFWTCD